VKIFKEENSVIITARDLCARKKELLDCEIFKSILSNSKDPDVLYNEWRMLQRFCVIQNGGKPIDHRKNIETAEAFQNLVRNTYRDLRDESKVSPMLYRQLPSGFNIYNWVEAGKLPLPSFYDKKLSSISSIQCMVVDPPCIFKTRANTRRGLVHAFDYNLFVDLDFNALEWYSVPVWVGKYLAYIYFHRSFFTIGTCLANLFEMVQPAQLENYKKPDLMLFFGVSPDKMGVNGEDKYPENLARFYQDKDRDIFLGFVANRAESDYFGYGKKTLLTLHNLKSISENKLPIHGAMAKIRLPNNNTKNIIIVGDSGAGKSESLEALRRIGSDYDIIFDDMGSVWKSNRRLVSNGTEVGAFVRTDDLEDNYGLTCLDRAIFLNPFSKNARLLMIVADYETIVKETAIDGIFYANNYTSVATQDNIALRLFKNSSDAINVFARGARLAKGTTSEQGLVETRWSNPFGAVQDKGHHDPIAYEIINFAFNSNIPVGEIFTQLGISGCESSGPEFASKQLLEFLKSDLRLC
jgi:hypothetical protein